ASDELDLAIQSAREHCSGIADEFNKMKTLAGINTAVTGVGTLAGGGAIATGFAKVGVDKKAEEAEIKLTRLREIEAGGTFTESVPDNFLNEFTTYFQQNRAELAAEQARLQAEKDELERKSKNLGNWRTGLIAGNTATNVAGAIIAGKNKATTDLKGAIDDCKASLKDLPRIRMQARMDGADTAKLDIAEKIISACGAWEYTDTSKIDNRANAAMWSSIVGAGMGAAGTVTSAVANTDKTRDNNTDKGKANEKNLNTASNVLAIGATAASATAVVFNATQIAAIKKASAVADKCEEALQ
ncbi:MAG: hypothetical protein FWF97_04045, partial [Alphaproteobacteria bacterium]|nr:hypothetical protein [Alphaproteobacteria bacterium]